MKKMMGRGTECKQMHMSFSLECLTYAAVREQSWIPGPAPKTVDVIYIKVPSARMHNQSLEQGIASRFLLFQLHALIA